MSALDLLEPPTPPKREPSAWISPRPCEACGKTEINHWSHPMDSQRFGHRVCIAMNLTLNHVHHGLARAAGKWDDEISCCHDKHGIHGKSIKRPTREQWLDHARSDMERAKAKWVNHLPSLIAEVGLLRVKYGITPDEAPVVSEDQFTVHLTRPAFPSRPWGYCGREFTMTEGNGGGVPNLPDGRSCHWMICNKCNDKHGRPDLDTHPNLKVHP